MNTNKELIPVCLGEIKERYGFHCSNTCTFCAYCTMLTMVPKERK